MFRQLAIITAVLFSFPSLASADFDPKLYGQWTSTSVRGSACDRLLKSVAYEFDQDGYYKISSETYMHGEIIKQQASGTYETKDGKITGHVSGVDIGPFDYHFEKEQLVIRQNEPSCLIYLKSIKPAHN